MINRIQLKICGITRLVDAEAADRIGADFLGFILYPKSPRFIPLATFEEMKHRLPQGRKVAVMVRPTIEKLTTIRDAGFDFFQLHFDPDADRSLVESWGSIVTPGQLWPAPRLAPDQPFPEWLPPLADTFQIDTFRKGGFGGSGKTGDWDRFRNLQSVHPEKKWVLAGGLGPSNMAEALAQTGAKVVDVSSGVEVTPGIKDPKKLEALAAAIRA
ncbi:MAG: phosphoribosylanthranilate isomerase [Verrucomicrobia bacterium]|nr:MAG: phosphoribosylanthranilate isomerase [Verrucomicrobiota bacterium]